jgi:flagellar M-ring protein FliF
MDWLKKLLARVKGLWGKWSWVQRIILIGICAAVLVGFIALVSVSSTPSLVPVIDAPIRDETALDRIIMRINEEDVKVTVSAAGLVQVPDEKTARRMRAILIREDLIPQNIDPWQIFDQERWTITDFERNVNLRRAITQAVTDHIKAIDGVDDASVTIVIPEDKLFSSEQNPVSASVIITPKPGSDITQNRKKVEGIQKILKLAVEGLKDENIVIADQAGVVLNDFEGMKDFDRLSLIEKENKERRRLEMEYRAKLLSTLQSTFGASRVRELDVKIEMDMSKKTVQSETYKPFVLKERTPGLAYDDSQQEANVVRSEATTTTEYKGTGFNPEGPPGVEGQTPPAYKDMQNMAGEMKQTTTKKNYDINSEKAVEERSPEMGRRTVSVNIDGKWERKYDEKGNLVKLPNGSLERTYTALTPEEIRSTVALLQNAIGYNAARGDAVTVQNIPFDHTAEFAKEDEALIKQKQVQMTVIIVLSALAALLFIFILLRVLSRELERRRRLAEEERGRREEQLRQEAYIRAEEEGMDVSISVEERSRMELQESVTNMAKEHPEDVAALLRTWLLEE